MTILDEFLSDPERVLDRLVDGELAPHERRELLAGLDEEPAGWRRCALAFLEAQTWRWQLSRVAAEPILAQVASAAPRTRVARKAQPGAGFLAIAASLAVAFALGTRFSTSGALAQPQQNRNVAPAQNVPPSTALAKADTVPSGEPQTPWQTVTLTPVGGAGQPIQVRVANEPNDRTESTAPARSAWSGLLSRGFETAGWQVNRRQGVVPLNLTDGRQIAVPVEEIDIKSPDFVQF